METVQFLCDTLPNLAHILRPVHGINLLEDCERSTKIYRKPFRRSYDSRELVSHVGAREERTENY